MNRPRPVDVDPVTLEVISGKLLATVDEMGIIMAKTSMSPIVYEVLDFACGLCDPRCDLIAQSNGITLFTGHLRASSPRPGRALSGQHGAGRYVLHQ